MQEVLLIKRDPLVIVTARHSLEHTTTCYGPFRSYSFQDDEAWLQVRRGMPWVTSNQELDRMKAIYIRDNMVSGSRTEFRCKLMVSPSIECVTGGGLCACK